MPVLFHGSGFEMLISNSGLTLEHRHTNTPLKVQRLKLGGESRLIWLQVYKVNAVLLNFSGEKPFECKLCHQRSRDYSAMIKHLRTHNGASPYQCTICQDFCPSLAAMQKHMKGHKPEEVPADWRIEKTYLYVCYVWAGLGLQAQSDWHTHSHAHGHCWMKTCVAGLKCFCKGFWKSLNSCWVNWEVYYGEMLLKEILSWFYLFFPDN